MKREIAYLTNQYPGPSHSFIRREITALENIGWKVHRFTHRKFEAPLVDKADVDELSKTTVLLLSNPIGAIARCMFRSPFRSWRAVLKSIRMAWTGERRFIAHLGYFGLACALSLKLRRLGISHLHAHFSTNPSDVAYLCNILCGVTFSITLHATYEYDDPTRRLNLRDKFSSASFIVAISDHGYLTLTSKFPEYSDKIKLIRCGLGDEWLNNIPTPVPQSFQLLSIARLAEQKNPTLLIHAIDMLHRQGIRFRLVIAGDGPLRPKVEQLIDQYGLSDYVHLAGWCSQQEIKDYLEQSIAVVLSSQSEGIPIAIMESFALGRSAIATNVGGVKELVETGCTGWLVPPDDRQALCEAIAKCLAAKPQEIQSLANAGRKRVLEYDVRKSASALDEEFRRIKL